MIEQKTNNRNQIEVINLESHVRQDHLLRKIDGAIDYTHIYVEGQRLLFYNF